MSPLDPKIIILDNDETTGSYKLLFILYDFLIKSHAGCHVSIKQISEIIWDNNLIKNNTYFNKKYRGDNIFRPYLTLFLKKIVEMKRDNKLDYIVMLTNQHTGSAWTDSSGKAYTISKIIADILSLVVGNDYSLWDIILTRDLTAPTIYGYNIKYLSRVFRELNLPIQAWSYKYVWFIDDLAEEPFAQLWRDSDLRLNDLPKPSVSSKQVYQKVAPYRTQISLEDLFLLSNKIIHTAEKNSKYTQDNYANDIELIKNIINETQQDIYEDLLTEEKEGFSSKKILDADTTFLVLASKLNDFYDIKINGGRKRKRSKSAKRQRRITEFIEESRSSSPRRNHTTKKIT